MNNINYNSELVLTYKSFDKKYSDLCYQIQLLQAFNMLKYDDYILQKNIENIYELIKNNNEIKNILLLISKKMKNYELFNTINSSTNSNINNFIYFQLLFSYNYFEIFHKCYSKYINDFKNNTLKHDYFEELKTFINNNDL